MTLHSLFDLSTMEHRHLLLAYVAVALLQGAYATRLIRSWLQFHRRHPEQSEGPL